MHLSFSHSSIIALLVVGCAASAPRTAAHTNSGAAPRFLNLPVYAGAIENAEPTVQQAWSAWEALKADAPPDGSESLDADGWRNEVLRPWMRNHTALSGNIHQLLEPLAQGTAAQQLFAELLPVMALEDMVDKVNALPLPPSVRGHADLEQAQREYLGALIASIRVSELPHWERCSELVRLAPASMQGWYETCRRRDHETRTLVEEISHPTGAGTAITPAGVAVSVCDGASPVADAEAPPPDTTARPEIALVADTHVPAGFPRDRILRLLEARIGRTETLLSRREIRAADALVAQRKIRREGPVCGQAPALSRVLAVRHPNLIVATVGTACQSTAEAALPTCVLSVRFRRPGNPTDVQGVPRDLTANVEHPTASAWTQAVARLVEIHDTASSTSSTVGGTLVPARVSVLEADDDDPFLKIVTSVRTFEQAIDACTANGTALFFHVRLTVTGAGEGRSVQIDPERTEAPDASARALCVQHVIERIAWPCTRSGADTPVDVRLCVASR